MRQAQRIHLWTYHLGRSGTSLWTWRPTPPDILCALARRADGACAHRKHAVAYEVRHIQNSWREADWSWGKLSERICFRVVTDPSGLYELHCLGAEWRLRGIQD